MIAVLDPVAAIGRGTINGLRSLGRVALFGIEGVSHLVRPPSTPPSRGNLIPTKRSMSEFFCALIAAMPFSTSALRIAR